MVVAAGWSVFQGLMEGRSKETTVAFGAGAWVLGTQTRGAMDEAYCLHLTTKLYGGLRRKGDFEDRMVYGAILSQCCADPVLRRHLRLYERRTSACC